MRPEGVALAYYVIDRIEGDVAVIIADDGRSFDVPKGGVPTGCREGTVLRIDTADRVSPDWTCAVIDEAERVRRLEQAREILRRLEDRDPGGDVTL
jgi:DUF3006 family protein